ncbi:hypothetical protein FRB97_006020 [Tulasnella sp. 331]|nr:hypothetical protein FRB97_006020 [Tulasnella sp. 331]
MRLTSSTCAVAVTTLLTFTTFCNALPARGDLLSSPLIGRQSGVVPQPRTSSSSSLAPAKSKLPPEATDLFFDQLLDHTNPSAGTFKQRYFFSKGNWTGAGAPIVLSNPGEQSADGFWNDLVHPGSLQLALMQALGAAGVVLEHRYWGLSSPFQTLTTENMQYLYVAQAIEDTKYFVENVRLPLNTNSTHSDVTPWINTGCSYPGLLSAYTQEKYADTFAAAWASSAPVEAIGDFWEYFEPIEEGMPKNCSSDLALAVTAIDQILLNGTVDAKATLKQSFGLQSLQDDDFASAISIVLGDWQEQQPDAFPTTKVEDPFFQFCDALETIFKPDGSNTTSMDAAGVGMPLALENYSEYFKTTNTCPNTGGACYSTYDYTVDQYTNWTVGNEINRQWQWMTCTEFGYWQDGDPGNYSSIVSSLITEQYNIRQCNHMFPDANGNPGNFSPAVEQNNNLYGGWQLKADRLFVVNGQFDPWRSASLSSDWAPTFQNTTLQEVAVVEGGHHCWDWSLQGAKYDPSIKSVVDLGISNLKGWLGEWYANHTSIPNTMPANVDYWAPVFAASETSN